MVSKTETTKIFFPSNFTSLKMSEPLIKAAAVSLFDSLLDLRLRDGAKLENRTLPPEKQKSRNIKLRSSYILIQTKGNEINTMDPGMLTPLKVHKRDTFVGSDFEFFTIFANSICFNIL
jgi:hypothetical protein